MRSGLLKAALGSLARRGVSTQPQDNVLLKGLVFHGYHGVLPEERTLGQKFVVDATLAADLRQAGTSDELRNTVDYAAVYRDIKAEVEGAPCRLIETVAERIAAGILARHGSVHSVRVGIHKPHVAVEGVVHSLGVEITRGRKGSGV